MGARHYRFRNFTLDPAARELWKNDELVALPGSALDCLVYLVEQRERAVGRDELIAAVWGRADVADTLLAQTVLRVRRTLGDSGSDGAIRTVARFGYRWVEETAVGGDVSEPVASRAAIGSGEAGGEVTQDPGPPVALREPLPRRRTFWPVVALVLGMTCIAMLAVLWFGRSGSDPAETAVVSGTPLGTSSPPPALVLPANVPDAADWSWLRLGLMDLVGNRLRQGGLPTAPSENVLALLGGLGDADLAATPAADGAWRIAPDAEYHDGAWRVRLHARRDAGPPHEVEATSEDVLEAARSAADVLLIRLGYTPPQGGNAVRSLALEELVQRTKAAILADQFDLARYLIEQAPATLRDAPEVELRLAQIDQGRGLNAEAEVRLQALLDRVPASLDPALRGRILISLGSTQYRRRQLAPASQTFDEAIEVLVGAGDPIALAGAYGGRAAIASQDGKLDQAAADLGRARVEMEAGGDALGLAQVDMNLGLVQAKNYRPAQALPMLRGAEARIAVLGAREELAYVRYGMVGAQLQLLDYSGAEATVALFWPPEAHTGNARLRWRLTVTRVYVLLATGRLDEADALLSQIERGAGDADDYAAHSAGRALTALVVAARGRFEEAAPLAKAALTGELEYEQPDLYLTTWAERLRCLRRSGQVDAAAAETEALRSWVEERSNPWRRIHSTLAEAEQAWALGRTEAALQRFADAFEQAEGLSIPDDLVQVAEPYALALIGIGQVDRASTVVGRVAAWAEHDVRAAWAQAQLYRAQARPSAWERTTEQVLRLAGQRALPAASID
ncbi:MAG: winged helix-turn-helix domain-containing protein [Xanthomonadales bacterium]|nr:winged helix-turn-helix domain-containing protein [Xanthomonadales bacterium]